MIEGIGNGLCGISRCYWPWWGQGTEWISTRTWYSSGADELGTTTRRSRESWGHHISKVLSYFTEYKCSGIVHILGKSTNSSWKNGIRNDYTVSGPCPTSMMHEQNRLGMLAISWLIISLNIRLLSSCNVCSSCCKLMQRWGLLRIRRPKTSTMC